VANKPSSVEIRAYQVGFGDCFLLFVPTRAGERKILIDCGSIAQRKKNSAEIVGEIIKDVAGADGKPRIDVVVATHRHRDHISGFATAKARNGTGDIIKSLNPDLIVQPWTEDPKLAPNATSKEPCRMEEFTPSSGPPPAIHHIGGEETYRTHCKAGLADPNPAHVVLDR